MVVIIMGKDLHVCQRPYFIVTWNDGGALKRSEKKKKKKNDSYKFYVGLKGLCHGSPVHFV